MVAEADALEEPNNPDEELEAATSGDAPAGLEPDMEEPNNPDEEDPGDEEEGSYVSRLRSEAARYRTRARDAEGELQRLSEALWTERVRALGLLADPEDLPLDPERLEDPDAIREAAEELLAARPHLRSRRIRERAGQGEGSSGEDASLSSLLRLGT